jgi:hypothetical protein
MKINTLNNFRNSRNFNFASLSPIHKSYKFSLSSTFGGIDPELTINGVNGEDLVWESLRKDALEGIVFFSYFINIYSTGINNFIRSES